MPAQSGHPASDTVPGPARDRAGLAAAPLLVVKVGSSSLTDPAGFLAPARLEALVDALAGRAARGGHTVLVSSGAQAAGMGPMGLAARPRHLAEAQAAASVGQGLLMAHYTEAFARHGLVAGQVLLTPGDVVHRSRYSNARRALRALLARGIVPVVNENDAVATDEIRFGDNDRLAALVAHIVRADGLVLLTDIDGLYTAPPSHAAARLVARVDSAADLAGLEISGRGSAVGTGGMRAKIQAAGLATSSGIPVFLTAARLAASALDPATPASEVPGTFFAATGARLSPKRLWLGYAAAPRGRLTVDEGAARAITVGKKSLLAVGVTGVDGDFGAGEPVEVAGPDGHVIARGLAGYPASDMAQVAGLTLDEIAARLGRDRAVEAIHRDELVTHARARRP
ncbi:MAG: glutamate 5-kinase [Bifidobacteriaceae bacterium]|nr:glutamate 5-kinase [Bifidobacteriaceae bacterium]